MSSNILIAKFRHKDWKEYAYAMITVKEPEEISLSDIWPEGVFFYSNLRRYEISGNDREYTGKPDPNWENPVPMGAYIHSGIAFYRGTEKVDKFDSGLAGYLVGHNKDDVERMASKMCAYPEFETLVQIQVSKKAEDLLACKFDSQDDIFIEGFFQISSYGSSRLEDIKQLEENIKKEYLSEEEAKTFEWINYNGL